MLDKVEKIKRVSSRQTPSTDSYFMGRLIIEAACCKDPEYQHAVLIVDSKDRAIAFGTNYIPTDYQRTVANWIPKERQRSLIVAEEVAVDRAVRLVSPTDVNPFISATMYLTGPPSLRGVRRCVQVGIKTLIYGPQKPEFFDESEWEEAKLLAKDYNVVLKPFDGNLNWLRDRIKKLGELF